MRRFINADVVAGNISNAVTLNRYAYANGNPVSNVDPFGLSAEERGSDDPSLNYYKAIVAVRSSLPIVGHAMIFFLADNGTWYSTEFNTTSDSQNLNELKAEAQILEYRKIPQMVDPSTGKFIYHKEWKYVVLSGNFNESVELAKKYYNEQRMGRYNFVFNNCSDYLDALLNVADVDGMFTQIFLGADTLISIPVVRVFETSLVFRMDSKIRDISNRFIRVGEIIENYWGWGGSAFIDIGNFIYSSSNRIGDSVGSLLQSLTNLLEPINKIINKGADKIWDFGNEVWDFGNEVLDYGKDAWDFIKSLF